MENKCILCKKNVFLPVSWNSLRYPKFSNLQYFIPYKKCKKSYINLTCLNCCKSYIDKHRKFNQMFNKEILDCPNGCCKGYMQFENLKMHYGEIDKNNSELSEENLWNFMDSCNIFNFTCNICDKKLDSIQESFDHSKKCIIIQ